jgi:SAM-dependent methyltransferase
MSGEGAERLYGDLAWLWPILSPPGDYEEESGTFADVIEREAEIPVRRLLHLTCGGGHVDRWLKERFDITGVDQSEEMLALARSLNPEVEYVEGDVRAVRLGRLYDAVFIDDGVVYMLTEDDLGRVFETAYVHLREGGVALVYVENDPGTFEQQRTKVTTRTSGDVALITLESQYDPDPSDTTCETTFVYIIRRGGREEVEVDHHVTGIFPLDVWRRRLRETGFDVRELDFGHSEFPDGHTLPMFACLKPAG